ncbi:MAG: amidohydrolase family protein [Bacteroidota bacterium]
MRKLLFFFMVSWGISTSLFSQETFTPNGVQDPREHAYAFKDATIFVDFETQLEGATLLIREGEVVQVGTNVSIPDGFTVVDLAGKYIYPSLIDLHTSYGMPEIKRAGTDYFRREQFNSNTDGPYNANQAIKSEIDAASVFTADPKVAKTHRGMGFGAVLTFHPDGIARGTSAFVSLADDNENLVVLGDEVAAHYSFDKGSSTQSYPSSSMGYISLLRQTYLDAAWYRGMEDKPFTDKSLDAWIASQELPQIFEVNNWQSVLRADKIGDEFDVQYVIKGGGDEYKRIDKIRETGASMIIPINFPAAYDVEDPLDAYEVSLAAMKHWELAPTNLATLAENGIEFAITPAGIKKGKDFWANLRTAIGHGLSESEALKALTYTPAKILGMEDKVGSLKKGGMANFLISSGNLFNKEVILYENWIQGKPYVLQDMDVLDIAGIYELKVGDDSYDLEIHGKAGQQKAKIVVNDSTYYPVSMNMGDASLSMNFTPKEEEGAIRLSGWTSGKDLKGSGQQANGDWITWEATYVSEKVSDKPSEESGQKSEENKPEVGEVIYPFVAYGTSELPTQENILIKNATVWTMEDDGILENTDVRIEDGKIVKIGKNLKEANARVIDGTDMHLTPGIVDEHSHIAATSINDVAVNSSMVRIEDVINSEDQEIYRALSGGVTALQILHGSANPIGGQSALIKLRWGKAPEEMKIKASDGYIKFALGENVKRSRSSNSIRYPLTRMGVEQVFVDAFSAARDYEKKWEAYNALTGTAKANATAPRKDLVHEAILEILNKERFVSCHSYVQSEINMLMKVAEQFDFNINTFTHILEGYKVADKMAEHGVGGSTFADWWAYKWEVRYAIPYNPAIMAREGVVTAVNSDNSEMMRRLNQEAAKSVKYADLDEIESFKMATLNPAKLLHLDDRIGSIKVGKDADVVLWTDHPLSIYAIADKTLVDGIVYFDQEEDQKRKYEIQLERARLIQKMKEAKGKGGATQRFAKAQELHFHCETVFTYGEK